MGALAWALVGLLLGGFLNLLITRLPMERRGLRPPFHCHLCRHPLAWADLVPLLGFWRQRGTCRFCGRPLPRRHLAVELATALLFFLAYWRFGPGLELLTYSFYLSVLVVVFAIDLRHRLILNVVTYPMVVICLGLAAVTPGLSLKSAVWGAAIYGGMFVLLFLLAVLIYRRGDALGLGDVKLAFVLGLMTGVPRVLVAILVGILLGAVAALAVLSRGRSSKDVMPYGTSLSVGGMIAILFGDALIDWYLG